MAVTAEAIRRVAALARLELEADEVRDLTEDLNRILEHVDTLGTGDPAHDHARPGGPTPREASTPLDLDAPGPDPLTRPPGAFAPEFRDGFFTVPRLDSHAPDAGSEDER